MSVGVAQVDRQHQKLLDLFNRLEKDLADGRAARGVRGLFFELASYAKYHFSTEANLMRAREYPGLADHLAAHGEFTSKVAELELMLQRDGGDSAALEASRFLRGWIVKHIIVVDRLAFAGDRRPPVQAMAPEAPAVSSAPTVLPEADPAVTPVTAQVNVIEADIDPK